MIEGGFRLSSLGKATPRVSIITVVYNAERLITEFFENVTPFLSDDVELVIIDGGSTDATVNILQQHNNLIAYWKSEPDDGIYDAMNKATKAATGKWLYFMGADDRLLGGFTKVVKSLKVTNAIYYGKVIFKGEVTGSKVKKYHFTKRNICHQSIFYPAKVFTYHQYQLKYKIYADQYLNLVCYADKRFEWQFVDELVAIYDTRGFSSFAIDEIYLDDLPKTIKEYLGRGMYMRYKFRKFKADRKNAR